MRCLLVQLSVWVRWSKLCHVACRDFDHRACAVVFGCWQGSCVGVQLSDCFCAPAGPSAYSHCISIGWYCQVAHLYALGQFGSTRLQTCSVGMQVHLLERCSRGHLMGFADLLTEGGDRLYVIYKWQDRFFEMDGALCCCMFLCQHHSLTFAAVIPCTSSFILHITREESDRIDWCSGRLSRGYHPTWGS